MTAPTSYYAPEAGLPPQTRLTTDRSRFNEAYVVIPRGCLTDIVASRLPFWDDTRLWVLARPLSGFAETFSQYLVEVSEGGGSSQPEPDPDAEAVIFVLEGSLRLVVEGAEHVLEAGGYAFLAPGAAWTAHQTGSGPVRFHWLRKAYERVEGIDLPDSFVVDESDVEPLEMPGTDGAWTTTREGFRDLMARLHGADGPFRASTRRTPEMRVQFLAPDIAILHSRFWIDGEVLHDALSQASRESVGTRVMHKVGGRWRIVATQNTDVRLGRRH